MEKTQSSSDVWSEWVLKRRYGKDSKEHEEVLAFLTPIRDRVLTGAEIVQGDTVLDVGCGDGLLAFAALGQTKPSGQVIFSDISPALLEVCQKIAEGLDATEQCTFIETRACDLQSIPDVSVDAVVLRSVLIYEEDKAQAFREFHRVLRPGGRLSFFEPINSFDHEPDESGRMFLGYKVPEIASLAAKVIVADNALIPIPMINFDERDLLRFALDAGFVEISLDYEARIEVKPPFSWETLIHHAPNPKAATLNEVLDRVLTHSEKERFVAVLRPLVEQGGGRLAHAEVYCRARKH